MFVFGKMSQTAIVVVSRLAEEATGGSLLLSSEVIADDRNLSQPLVGKILTILARHGIVHGVRGPQGGYRLARKAKEVSLYDVVRLFERENDGSPCPFGPGWCGHHKPCPLHKEYEKLSQYNINFLKKHHFGDFSKTDI